MRGGGAPAQRAAAVLGLLAPLAAPAPAGAADHASDAPAVFAVVLRAGRIEPATLLVPAGRRIKLTP
jgi:hypothetical protein